VKWLRDQIAVVEQTTTLFDGTIFENIAICKDGATLEDVQEAAKLVCDLDRRYCGSLFLLSGQCT
jgi:ATP-binding cassette subfamily B protein